MQKDSLEVEATFEAYGVGLILGLEEASARDISSKERDAMKDSQFLDSERRSFPIKNCEDVRAAVKAWGRYRGPMSFETFKAKLTKKAQSLGCSASLPDSWKEK